MRLFDRFSVAPWAVIILTGIGVLVALVQSTQSRDRITGRTEMLIADGAYDQQEAAVIRELFFLENEKKRNFQDLTQVTKQYSASYKKFAEQVDPQNSDVADRMAKAYASEIEFIENYKSTWAIARNSRRSVDRLSKKLLADVRRAGPLEAYEPLFEFRHFALAAAYDQQNADKLAKVTAQLDILFPQTDGENKSTSRLGGNWRDLQTHLRVLQENVGKRNIALSKFSTSELDVIVKQIKSEREARLKAAYANEVKKTNYALGACVCFFILISILVLKLASALKHTSTEKERLDQAVTERTVELEETMKEVTRLAEAKTAFLANMSHEIRTPMNGVIGTTELLEDTPLNNEQIGYVETVKNSAGALLTVINDILDFSKIESGKLTLNPAPFRLDEMLDSLTQLISVTAREKGVEVIYYYPPEYPTGFIADEGRLRQVLMNIVGNAVKFTLEGYVAIDVECNSNGETADLAISVRDTGIGMPPDMLDKIFESFIQVDDSSRRQFEGTGLGLAISQRLVEQFNGRIDVESKLGEGSGFIIYLTLPVAEVEPANQKPLIDLSAIEPLKALVVDDIELNRRILERRFTFHGHEIVSARSAEEALTILNDPVHRIVPFDVAFLDFQMPNMDGLELSAEIRRQPAHKNLPIIMLSSVTGVGDLDGFKALTGAYALHKPATTANICGALQKALFKAISIEEPAKPVETQTDDSALGNGATILVAEDSTTNQRLVRKMCEKLGFIVQIAENGERAVQMYKQEKPSLVLMDWSMPKMNGIDATIAIREFEARKGAARSPIIGLSANAMAEHEQQGLSAGMDAYLTKPIRFKELREGLRAFVEPAEQPTEEFQPATVVPG